jgi:hypothetical protein
MRYPLYMLTPKRDSRAIASPVMYKNAPRVNGRNRPAYGVGEKLVNGAIRFPLGRIGRGEGKELSTPPTRCGTTWRRSVVCRTLAKEGKGWAILHPS